MEVLRGWWATSRVTLCLLTAILLNVSAPAIYIRYLTVNFVFVLQSRLLAVGVDIGGLGELGRSMIMFRLVLRREIFSSASVILSPWRLMG